MPKWSKERHENSRKTIEAKRAKKAKREAAKIKKIAEPPVVEMTNDDADAEEFARYVVTAWRTYKGR